jgi:hypothetical protein
VLRGFQAKVLEFVGRRFDLVYFAGAEAVTDGFIPVRIAIRRVKGEALR